MKNSFGLLKGIANFQLMAFTKAPSGWLGSGYTVSGSGTTAAINFGISGNTAVGEAFPQITSSEANASTGDIRMVYYGIVEALYQSYIVKANADLPNRMTFNKSSSVNSTTGLITANYSFQFVLVPTGLDVTTEAA